MEIHPIDAARMGVSTAHESMENGERRFRLIAEDGSSYVRTEASSRGGWQRSHLHRSMHETYIVQSGWMALVERLEGGDLVRIFTDNQVVTTTPGIAHNAYLSGDTVIHTVKHGGTAADWIAAPELDDATRHLSEDDVLRLGRASRLADLVSAGRK